jgi:DNA-binding IclR family transcriptional regulator
MAQTQAADRVEQALSRGTAMLVSELAATTQLPESDIEQALVELEREGRVIPAHGGRWGLPPTDLEDRPTDQPGES